MKPNYLSAAVIVFLGLLVADREVNYRVVAHQRDLLLASDASLLATARESTDGLKQCVAQLKHGTDVMIAGTSALVEANALIGRQRFILQGNPRIEIWPRQGTFTEIPGQNYETDLPAGK